MGLFSAIREFLRPVAQQESASAINGASWSRGSMPAAGLHVGEREAMACATAWACTRAISETMGSISAIVYRQLDERGRERASGSRAWQMLHDEPCPLMDAMQFYELGTSRMINRGNFFAEIERDANDRPIALWPLHNSRVIPYWAEDGLEWHVLNNERIEDKKSHGWRYHVVPDRDMFNLVGPGALDGNGILAAGVLPRATEEISLDLASQQYGASFFGQGGRPSGVVTHPGFIADETRRRTFREDVNKLHSGRENWNKVAVLWENAQWKELTSSPEQAQFIQTRSYQSKVICRFYNVPPAIVQIFDDYKFSTVDAMIRQFIMLTIRPTAVRWERAINRQIMKVRGLDRKLTPVFNEDLDFEFLLNALLRGDPKTQAEANQILRQNGIINADEWRSQENMNPLPNGIGEAYIAPLNFTTLDRLISGQSLSAKQNNGSGSSQSLPDFSRQQLASMIREVIEAK